MWREGHNKGIQRAQTDDVMSHVVPATCQLVNKPELHCGKKGNLATFELGHHQYIYIYRHIHNFIIISPEDLL